MTLITGQSVSISPMASRRWKNRNCDFQPAPIYSIATGITCPTFHSGHFLRLWRDPIKAQNWKPFHSKQVLYRCVTAQTQEEKGGFDLVFNIRWMSWYISNKLRRCSGLILIFSFCTRTSWNILSKSIQIITYFLSVFSACKYLFLITVFSSSAMKIC